MLGPYILSMNIPHIRWAKVAVTYEKPVPEGWTSSRKSDEFIDAGVIYDAKQRTLEIWCGNGSGDYKSILLGHAEMLKLDQRAATFTASWWGQKPKPPSKSKKPREYKVPSPKDVLWIAADVVCTF